MSAPDFRALGHALVDRLADYLATVSTRPVLPPGAPDALLERWPVETRGGADLLQLLSRVVDESNHLHHPRYVGHQVTAPLPETALAELVSALLNNGNAVYEMGPVATAMERNLVYWLAGKLGFPAGADGVFTSGGSAGNLTALLAARQARAGFDVWSDGGGPPLSVLASEQTHYCVGRATQIMGLGRRGAWPVPVDAAFRLRPEALRQAKHAAEAAGRRVFAVVASAGSTATGAFDPLDAVADFCQEENLWLHVDGAHGASTMLSPTHAPRLRGIERADSVVWDAHKMMLVPALCTAVLFRDGQRSFEAFAQEASYLYDGRAHDEWWNLGQRTLECTKNMMALKLYVALAGRGEGFFADYIDAMYARARRFAEMIQASADLELPVVPDCNIVCFRHRTGDSARIRQRLLADGRFYLVQTRLPTGVHLRVTIINPDTTDDDLAALLDAVRAAAG